MDKQRIARMSLLSIATLCTCLLLLFLPMLIWSTPWSTDGYYHSIEKTDFSGFYPQAGYRFAQNDDGWISICHFHERSGLQRTGYALDEFDSLEFKGDKIMNPFSLWYIKYLEWSTF